MRVAREAGDSHLFKCMVKVKKQKMNIDEKITGAMGSMKSIIFHTILFILFLTLPLITDLTYDSVLLILTTIVSLEAIYLALFIQISINRQSKALDEVSDDIEEIQEDMEEVSDDVQELNKSVDEIEKDMSEIQEDVEEINQSVDEIEKDVEEISDDVEGIAEDVEEIQEEVDEENPENISEDMKEQQRKDDQKLRLEKLESMLTQLITEIKEIKK